MWLKADALSLNDGDAVTTWTDSSGNGFSPTQSTSTKRPTYKTNILNSKPVVRFDGTDDFLNAGDVIEPANVTMFTVFKSTNVGNVQVVVGKGLGGSYLLSYSSAIVSSKARSGIAINTTTEITSSATPTLSNNTYYMHSMEYDASNVSSWLNGGNIGQTAETRAIGYSSEPLTIGILANLSGFPLNGDIAEVLIYNSALSSTNRSRIENYLRDKYAITVLSGITSATRDTGTTYNSSAGSAKLVTSSTDTGEFTQSVNVGDTNVYNLSAYARTDGSAVTSSDVELFYNGSTISTTYTSVGSGWYQLTGTVTGANASRVYGVQVKANKTVYVDNFSLNNYASSGTLTSSIFDTEFSAGAAWGTLTYTSSGSTVAVKARTSNDSGMSGATAFSSCNAITSGTDISSNNCVTDGHRYIQYQLALSTSDTSSTPTFSDISIAFATYDSDAPSVSLTALTPDPNSDNTPTLSGTATDSIGTVSNVQFQMDSTSGSWSSCSASDGSFNSASEAFSCTAATLTDGSHTMYVRATDSNGNTTSSSYASDTFTIDATNPVSIDLDSPGDNSYTNSERPSFKWKATTDATAGLSKYVLGIDNPSAGSGQASGDFTIDSIPTSRTTDYDTNKYTIKYENFSDSDSTNNYISVYTKSHNDWGSSENDGKIREGKVSWKVKAVDNASNETSSSRTLFVDRTNPNVEFNQVNGIVIPAQAGIYTNGSPIGSGMTTNDKTPTIYGKITDSLVGGDSSQTQDENGPKIASGSKQVEIKIEKKEGLGYKLITLYTLNMDKPWYTCDGKEVSDNSKQKCDKYLPFEYTPKENLELGTYKITLSGKDKADNSSSETTLSLNITTLAQITTPEEKKIIEEEIKPLKPGEQEKVKEELEITKPVEPSALEKAQTQISQTSKNILNTTGNIISGIFNGIGQGVRFTVDITGKALAFVGDKTGQALAFVGKTTGNTFTAMYNGTRSILAHVGQGISKASFLLAQNVGNGANAIGQGLAWAGGKIGQGVSTLAQGTGNLLASIGQGVGNTGKAIGDGYSQLANNAPGVTKTILTGIGDGVSATTSTIATIAQDTASTIGGATHAIATTTSTAAENAGTFIAGIANNVGKTTSTVTQNATKTMGNIASSIANTTSTIAKNTGSAIANATQNGVSNAKKGIANLAFTIGEKTEDISHGVGTTIIKIGYLFVPEPTKISNVNAVALSATSVKISWTTNHPANGKVNWGYEDGIYGFEDQTDKRTSKHEFILTGLKPDTEYHYEVMSQNRNYVYDANRKFKTPAK